MSDSNRRMIPNKKRWRLSDEEEEEKAMVESSPRKRWKVEEEKALVNGIKKHGLGRWKTILNDQQFSPFLLHRSNVSLKDKWRNWNRTLITNKSTTTSSSSWYSVTPQTSPNNNTDPRHKAVIFEALSPADKSDGVDNSKNESGGNPEKINNSVGESSGGDSDNQKKLDKKRLEVYASFAAYMINEAGNMACEAAEARNLKKIAEELVKLAD